MEVFAREQYDKLEQLVKSCGNIMLSALSVESNSESIKSKIGDANFVTKYDEEVQQKLIDGISRIFPDAHFFAEEKENFEADTKKGLCFVIDPIDGTTNFIHSLGASAISVALLIDGNVEFALIYDPYRNELFKAYKGKGAFLNGNSISVSVRDLELSVVAFGTTPYRKNDFADKGFSIAQNVFLNCADIRRSGSAALDMAYVACGRIDAFFECILSPWDYAAGALIIKEAGGLTTDFSGNDVGFSVPSSVLCSNKKVHDKLLALINK